MGNQLFSFFQLVFFFNLFFFVRINGTTTFLNFTFLVSASFIFYSLFFNKKFFGFLLPSLSTPSNLTFISEKRGILAFASGFLITVIEAVGKNIRPVSLTCRLRANISARHLLSAIFFSANLPFFGQVILMRYYIFEVLIAVIQRFVFSFFAFRLQTFFSK